MSRPLRMIPLRVPNMGQYGRSLLSPSPLVNDTQVEPPAAPLVSPFHPSTTRRPYTGNFQPGDVFWCSLPELQRSPTEQETLVLVVRRYTLYEGCQRVPVWRIDLQRTLDNSPYNTTYTALMQPHVYNYIDPPGNAPFLQVGRQQSVRRLYEGNFAVGDVFYCEPVAGEQLHELANTAVRVIASRTGRDLWLQLDSVAEFVTTESIVRQCAILYLDPPDGATGSLQDPDETTPVVSEFVEPELLTIRLVGEIDARRGPGYPAGVRGDAYLITHKGRIGMLGYKPVAEGDLCLCLEDNPGGTQSQVGPRWVIVAKSIVPFLAMDCSSLQERLVADRREAHVAVEHHRVINIRR